MTRPERAGPPAASSASPVSESFSGPTRPTLEAMTRHVEYAVDLVGIDHVGISSDFSFDYANFIAELTTTPTCSTTATPDGPSSRVAPRLRWLACAALLFSKFPFAPSDAAGVERCPRSYWSAR